MAASDGFEREGVDDPEALRQAEEAVAQGRPLSAGTGPRIEGAWVPVATQTGAGGEVALQDVARALASEGVTVGWDPYDPSGAAGFTPPGAFPRPYALQVPASQLDRARQVLSGTPPAGLTYGWDAQTPSGFGAPAPGEGESVLNDGFDAPRAPHVDGPELSDNERMARLASGRGSGCGIAIVVVCLVLFAMIALFALLRG